MSRTQLPESYRCLMVLKRLRAMRVGILTLAFFGLLGSTQPLSARPAAPQTTAPSNDEEIIVDDADAWVQPQCITLPCPGYGFNRMGPENGWQRNGSAQDVVFRGRALWTVGTTDVEQSTNDATWATHLPDSGPWEVSVFVPQVRTGLNDTAHARYCVGTRIPPSPPQIEGSQAPTANIECNEMIVNQASNIGRWVVLDTFEFPNSYGYVNLGDWVAPGDPQPPVSVLFDAVRWRRPGSATAVDIDAFLLRYPDGVTVDEGTTIEYCFRVTAPAWVELFWYNPNNGGWSSRIWEDYVTTSTPKCAVSQVLQGGGIRRVRADALNEEGGSLLDRDETYFYVAGGPPPVTPTLTPTATIRPTNTPPAPGPTPVEPTPVPPTAEPTVDPQSVKPSKGSYIVFLHGWQGLSAKGHSCKEGYTTYSQGNEFGNITQNLAESGYEIFFAHWDSNKTSTQKIEPNALCVTSQLAAIAREHPELAGKRRILMAHSMGGLVARQVLKGLKGKDVSQLITFGSPHLGVQSEFLLRLVRLLRPGVQSLDCKQSPGTCQLTTEYVRNDFNPVTPMKADVQHSFVGGSGGWILSAIFVGEDDGIILQSSSLGMDKAFLKAHAYAVRDTHISWPKVRAVAKPYENGGDSRKCLARILNDASLEKGTNFLDSCDQWRLSTFGAQQIAGASGTGGVQQEDPELVAGPIAVGSVVANGYQDMTFTVDGDAVRILGSWEGSGLAPFFIEPGAGSEIDAPELERRYPGTTVQTDHFDDLTLLSIELPKPQLGAWTLRLRDSEGRTVNYSLQVFLRSTMKLEVSAPEIVRERDRISISAHVHDGASPVSSAEVMLSWTLAGQDNSRLMTWNSAQQAYEAQVDAVAGVPGMGFQVVAKGTSSRGQGYERSASVMVAIADPAVLPELPIGRTGRVFLPLLSQGNRLDCPVAEREPNDSRADADRYLSLCSGWSIHGQLVPGDVRDAYLVVVERPMAMEAFLNPDVGSGDIDLYLFQEGAADFAAKSENSGAAREQISTWVEPGRYYLLAFPAGGQSITGSYAISWHEAP